MTPAEFSERQHKQLIGHSLYYVPGLVALRRRQGARRKRHLEAWLKRYGWHDTPTQNLLRELGACTDARAWVAGQTLDEAWDICKHGDWMAWLLRRMDPDWGCEPEPRPDPDYIRRLVPCPGVPE